MTVKNYLQLDDGTEKGYLCSTGEKELSKLYLSGDTNDNGE